MAKISDGEAARRLARAIASDLKLYNFDAIRAGTDLSSEVAAGRSLFESRVVESLHGLYDDAMAAVVPELRYDRHGAEADAAASDASSAGAGRASGHVAAAPGAAADRFGSFFADGSEPAATAKTATQAVNEAASAGSKSRLALYLIVAVAVATVTYLLASR